MKKVTDWVKRHKFWTVILGLVLLDLVLGAAGIWTNLSLLAGLAIAIWWMFNMKKVSYWLWAHLRPQKKEPKEVTND